MILRMYASVAHTSCSETSPSPSFPIKSVAKMPFSSAVLAFVKPFNNGLKSVSVPALNRIITLGWNYN